MSHIVPSQISAAQPDFAEVLAKFLSIIEFANNNSSDAPRKLDYPGNLDSCSKSCEEREPSQKRRNF